MIGTIATGFPGMNVISAATEPFVYRAALFALVLAGTAGVTLLSIARSKRLADFIDALSDERINWREKWLVLVRKAP
jgi:hypothetical protein